MRKMIAGYIIRLRVSPQYSAPRRTLFHQRAVEKPANLLGALDNVFKIESNLCLSFLS